MSRCLLAFVVSLLVLRPCPVFGHGPQIQVTNENNQITPRRVALDPYNNFPGAPTPSTNVYVMPLAPLNAFGGVEWFVQPLAEFQVTDPGVAWGYGWTFTDASNYTMTFPAGSNIRQTFVDGLKQWNGSSFSAALHSAQLAGYRSTGPKALSGSAAPSFDYAAITAPLAVNPDPHGSASFQLTGNGVIPDATHLPAAVDDGIYLAEMKFSLANQPANADPHAPNYNPSNPVQDSNSFYFVMYKNVPLDAALSAAQAAFPSASIQSFAVPEPGALGLIAVGAAMLRRRR